MGELADTINRTIREKQELEELIVIQHKFKNSPVCPSHRKEVLGIHLSHVTHDKQTTATCGKEQSFYPRRTTGQSLPEKPENALLFPVLGLSGVCPQD